MRIIRLLPCMVLALAACGDNKNIGIDAAGPGSDTGGGDDDDDDADIDAPPDAAPGTPSRVWAVGDFLTDNRRQAGAFASDATLPFNTATPPPIIVPNGAADEIFDGTNSTAAMFDARGSKIAYVSDQTMAGRFDLYVADADGSNSLLLVTGEVNIEIAAVALSPDGTKVAFSMDSVAINNGFDLYVIPTAGGTAVKLSPDRPVGAANQDQMDLFFSYEWSKNSQFIAFSADLTENGFDQPYVVDTNAATPVAVEILTRAEIATQASGAQGVRGKLLFDNSNNVYFRARVTTDNNSQFKLFKSDLAGAETEIAMPTRTDTTVAEPGAFGVTPDGATLVFGADAPTATVFNMFAQAVANPQTPTNLTNLTTALGGTATIRADFTTPLFFSPDSKNVALVGNLLATTAALTRIEPFVVAVDGTGFHRLFSIPTACGACDADLIAWTGDSQSLWVQGDLATLNNTELFRFDPTMTDVATLAPAVQVPTGGDLISLIVVAP